MQREHRSTRTTARESTSLLWIRLMRVHRHIERAAAEDLRRWGLSVPQYDVVVSIGASGGMTQQELANARLTTKGNLSQLLDAMEASGLVERVRDGRTKRLYLGEAGQRLLEEVGPRHEAAIAPLFCSLSGPEQTALRGYLRRIDRSLMGRQRKRPPATVTAGGTAATRPGRS